MPGAVAHAAKPGGLAVQVLSNRADVISADDALVAIKLPAGVDPSTVRVAAGGRDVTSAFAMRANGRFEGLVTGLAAGPNVLRAGAPGYRAARVTVLDHPNGGPRLSGPHGPPWQGPGTAQGAQGKPPGRDSH